MSDMNTVTLDADERSEYDYGMHPDIDDIFIHGFSVERIVEFFQGERFPNVCSLMFYKIPGLDFKHLADQGLKIESVEYLDINDCGTVSLDGIEQVLPKLSEINLKSTTNSITLEPLSNCRRLNSFICDDNTAITDLHGLEFCTEVRSISCLYTKIKRVEWLAEMLPKASIHFGGIREPLDDQAW